jgi:metallo-beta-lactamase class B
VKINPRQLQSKSFASCVLIRRESRVNYGDGYDSGHRRLNLESRRNRSARTVRAGLNFLGPAAGRRMTVRHGAAILLCVAILTLAVASGALSHAAPIPQNPPEWTEAFPPFQIADNLYYVGSKSLASYLITTPSGNILINSDMEANVPMIKASVEKLGFKFSDTKILLISHAHFDHDAGSALIKKQTGARYMVMDADVPVVESGGRSDFAYGKDRTNWYAPAKVDRVLHDGDTVKLGGVELVAHLTAGHTKGCTTWTMKATQGGKTYDVVIVGSPNVNPGYKLVNNAEYPQIAEDYERQFQVLKSLPCDIFLGAHGSYFDMEEKYPELKAGSANPFIDPAGYKAYVADREQAFRDELAKQKAAATK